MTSQGLNWKSIKAIQFASEHKVKVILNHSTVNEESLWPKKRFMEREEINNGDRLYILFVEYGANHGDIVLMSELKKLGKVKQAETRKAKQKSKSERVLKILDDIGRERKTA